jgi:hypothetical protein
MNLSRSATLDAQLADPLAVAQIAATLLAGKVVISSEEADAAVESARRLLIAAHPVGSSAVNKLIMETPHPWRWLIKALTDALLSDRSRFSTRERLVKRLLPKLCFYSNAPHLDDPKTWTAKGVEAVKRHFERLYREECSKRAAANRRSKKPARTLESNSLHPIKIT